MKRIFHTFFSLFFLVYFIAFTPYARATNIAPPNTPQPITNHEIWGIPWGISQSEFMEIAKTKTGIAFQPREDSESDITWCSAVPGQNISILEYPVYSLSAAFLDSTTSYQGLYASLFDLSDLVPFDAFVHSYEDILKKLVQQYGSPLYQCIYLHSTAPESQSGYLVFDLLEDDTHIKANDLYLLSQAYSSVSFNVNFDNITLVCDIRKRDGYDQFYLFRALRLHVDHLPKSEFTAPAISLGSYSDYLQRHPVFSIPVEPLASTPFVPTPPPPPSTISLGF